MEKNRFWLYPTVGFGAAMTSLTSYQNMEGGTTNGMTQKLISPSADLGINIDFIRLKTNSTQHFYVDEIIGIRAGYRMSVKSNNWKSNNSERTYPTPSYSNNAFYLNFSIGVGGFK
jgi:hypothetical protein